MTARPLPRLLSFVAILVLVAFLAGRHLPLGAQTPERVDVIVQFASAPGPADAAFVRGLGASIRYRYQVVPAMALSLPTQAMPALQANARVALIEPDFDVQADDAELDNTWGVKHIGAGTAHEATPPNLGTAIRVAVIDTGINYLHEDLAANYKGGWDFVNNDSDPFDDHGHGTHVSGTIGAVKNGNGVVGVAPEVHLYALKVLGANGSGSLSGILAAVDWAAQNGMHVTNNSYGGTGYSATAELAYANAAALGIMHVASAGNRGDCAGTGDNVGYPAGYRAVIAVAATDSTDARACFSSTGPAVEMAAPGVQINSTIRTGGYGSKWNGTSMASPHIAGTAALIRYAGVIDANGNGRINDEVRNLLADTALDLGAGGRDPWYGFGRVDVAAALAAVGSAPPLISRMDVISYAASGGKGNKDVTIKAATVYGSAAHLPGAAVSMTLTLNGAFYRTLSGTTDAAGLVSFTIKNAPTGNYVATVTSLSAGGLTWDGITPANSYTK